MTTYAGWRGEFQMVNGHIVKATLKQNKKPNKNDASEFIADESPIDK